MEIEYLKFVFKRLSVEILYLVKIFLKINNLENYLESDDAVQTY